MAKISVVARQEKRERLTKLYWDKRQALKKVVFDLDSSFEEKMEAQRKLNKLPKNSSPVRLRNRCKYTGRGRGYLRKFKMSRICLREKANAGLLPGVMKASW